MMTDAPNRPPRAFAAGRPASPAARGLWMARAPLALPGVAVLVVDGREPGGYVPRFAERVDSLGQAMYPTQAGVVRKAADGLRQRKLTPLAKKGFDVFFRVFR